MSDTHMQRVEAIALAFPEAQLVRIEAWGDEPTFRVNGKNFIFASHDGSGLSVKMPKDEAEAVVATDERCTPTGYGLGRHGWVSITLEPDVADVDWVELAEWIETSYLLVAPKRLTRNWQSRLGEHG